jgi:spore germination protein
VKAFAHEHNIKVVPSLFTLSGWLNHELLSDEPTRENFIQQIVEYTVSENFDGFDLDLEGVDAGDRDPLSALTSDVANALHGRGKLLTTAIPAKERDATTGWAGPYDYAAIGAAADLITVMAYEYRGPFSGPGSVAPIDWVERVAAFSTSQIPPDKVLLGLAFYGYDWNVTSGGTRSVGYQLAAALAAHFQAEAQFDPRQQSLTFVYTHIAGEAGVSETRLTQPRHAISTRQMPTCDKVPPSATPTPAARKPPPAAGTPEQHEVWLEDSTSAAARLQVARRYQVGGVAAWRLGIEDPGVWPVLADWREAATAFGR